MKLALQNIQFCHSIYDFVTRLLQDFVTQIAT